MWNGFDLGIFRWFEHQTDGVAIGVAKQFDWQRGTPNKTKN
jgi:hypothetical protein